MATEHGARVEAPAAPVAVAPLMHSKTSQADLTKSIETGFRQLTHAGAGVAFAEDGARLARVLAEIASQLGKHDAKLGTLEAALTAAAAKQPADAGASTEEVKALKGALDAMGARVGRLEEACEAADARAEAAEARGEAAARAVEYLQDEARAATARAAELRAVVDANGGGEEGRRAPPQKINVVDPHTNTRDVDLMDDSDVDNFRLDCIDTPSHLYTS
jgi:chromosome segregation ATPase